jgi:hypothetical protein
MWPNPLSALLGSFTRGGLDERVPFNPGGRLEITNHMGSISILSSDREELAVTAELEAPAWLGPRAGARVVAQTRIRLDGDRRSRRIVPDFSAVPVAGRGPYRALPLIHFTISVPADLTLVLRDRKSRIQLAGLCGDFDVHTHRGTVTAQDLCGRWRGGTRRGSIQLDRFRGSFDLVTARGDLELAAVVMEADSHLSTERGHASVSLAGRQGFSLHADLRPRARLMGRVGGRNLCFSGREVDTENGRSGPRLVVESRRGEIRLQAMEERA